MRLILLVSILISTTAHADRVDNRQVRQRSRIAQGVHSGELTRREAQGLRSGERHIRRLERRFEADGVVTGKESARLENAQDRMSRQIEKQKHDDQKRQ